MELDQKRVAWVDYAKGFRIVMVVMMHSTLGVEKAAEAPSWMDAPIAFAKPFRMPDFFLILGLALFEAAMVYFGLSALPSIGLGLAFIGARGGRALGAATTRNWVVPLRYAGQNSIIVYLAFFLPMAATRTVLLRFTPGFDLGVICLIVTGVAVIVPLAFYEAVKATRSDSCSTASAWARAAYWRPPSLVAAE